MSSSNVVRIIERGPQGPPPTITDKSIANPKLADMPANTIKGRRESDGEPEDILFTALINLLGLATQSYVGQELATVTAGNMVISALSNVAGTGGTYTADGLTTDDADKRFVMFTPHVTNTAINPFISINGGTQRRIRGMGGGNVNIAVGRLRANVPVLMRRDGADWRVISEIGGEAAANVVPLSGSAGSGVAYTVTSNAAPLISGTSLIVFQPHVANGGTCTVSIDGGTPIPVLTENSQNPEVGLLKGGARYLGQYATTGIRLIGVRNAAQSEADRVTDEALAAIRQLSTFTNVLARGGTEYDPIYVQGAPGFDYWVASMGDLDHTIRVGGGARYIDIRMLRQGHARPITISVASGATAKLITPTKIYTATGHVRVWMPVPGEYVFDATGGSVTEGSDANDPAPTCDLVFITGGQSHAAGWLVGAGMYGFQNALLDLNGECPSIWPIQGAFGSTGLVPYSGVGGAAYWWDPATDTPGPTALDWKAALDAKPVGQPAPSFIYWCMGQNDSSKMGQDSTLSIANYKATYKKLFQWMRDQIDTEVDTPILWSPIGAYDANTVPSDAQVAAIHWVEMEVAAEMNEVYIGPLYFDFYRGFYDQHPGFPGQAYQGYRLGSIYSNAVLGTTHPVGPRVTSIVEESGGLSYLINFEVSAAGNPLQRPVWVDGLAFYAAGADPLSANPLTITAMTWVTTTQLRCSLAAASPGAVMMWPWGTMHRHRAGRFIRDTNNYPVGFAWGNHWPLQPIKSGPF